MRSAGGGNRNQQQSLAKNSKPGKKDKSGGGEFSLLRAPYDPENPYYPYDPDPPEPGPGAGTSPIGNFEGIDQAGRFAGGWSFDPDNAAASNIIHFYIDGPAGSGTFLGSTTANLARPDVNSAYSITGQHGFRFQIPTQYQNGQQHTIYAYGLDTGPNGATHLSASPKTFTFNYTPAPPPTNTVVTFTYDELGNRKTMTDASGTVTYEYNQLSQLTAETRSFAGENLPDAPLPGNSFKLQYAYSISGQLKSLTDPFGQQINYGHDKAGRLQSVTGSTPFGGVTTYAQNPHYRAWGALQNLTYGNGVQMNIGFNSRLQAANYTLVGGGASAGSNLVQKAYQFYTDGAVRYVQDQLDARFDRFQTYDQLGRVTEGKSGAEARGQSVAQNQLTQNLPYRQSYQYDAFDNMTQRNNLHWGIDNWYNQSNNLTYAYQNNRQIGADYDADGRMLVPNTTSDYAESKYDAAGHLTRLVNLSQSDIYRFYDGDGKEAKRETRRWIDNSYAPAPPYGHWTQEKSFYIRSSVLGGEIISEAGTTGRKLKTYVKANGTTLATQNVFANAAQALTFEHTDAAGMSYRSTAANGEVNEYEGTEMSPVELDPKGANVGTTTPYIEELNTSEPPPEITGDFMLYDDSPTDRTGRKIGCVADKIRLPDFGQCRGEMESARLGGVFGLLEHAARMSALPPVKIGEWWRTYTTTPPDTGDVIQVGVENTYKLSDVYADNNSWSAMSNIISWEVKVNKTSDQTPQQKCDYKLARIFGDDDAVMGTATEPAMKKWNGIDKPVEGKTVFLEPERVRNRGGESPEKGTAHLFANKDGRGEDKVNAYTPPGYYGIPKGYPSEGEDGGMGAEKQNFLRVYYKPGSLTKYGYDGGLIINFTHIGPTTKNRTPILPKGVAPNSEGSIPVGVIGGYGNIVSVGGNSGGYGYYVHIHMIFNTWDGKIASTPSTKTRIDPRQVFCKEFGF
jgi:YD repeat-containing protein